ncbi:MAG: S-layer homology domain-containing protein [Firmicutes bacterium]|nr:S-layer homology domain-containing protein [Bacillota bacterium]
MIDLYYYLDNWKDADNTTDEQDKDSETGGDGIPDCQQVRIQYLVYKENGGTVSRKVEIATFNDNSELNTVYGSTATANPDFTFVTWSGRDVAVNDITVDNVIATTEPKSGPECIPSSTELVKGNAYTYTAIFLEDKIGGGDNKDQPDGTPDRYQVTINYVGSDTSKGSVGTLTKEVLTIYENGKDGKWASKGKVTASGSTATANGGRNYFSNWENNAGLATTYTATLGEQTIENAKGGATYTFTANFGYSGGGGGGGGGGGTITIPDDVPTGLNGKDHYAYVVGYPDGMVYPQKNITRAEVATIFFRLLTDETREANMTKSNGYNDVKDGAWYTCAVSTLSKMGIIKGYEDGSFKSDASISRAEFAAIAARFDPDGDKTPATFSDVSSHWAKDEISIAANHGWIKGYEDGSFKPDQKITRAETMTLVNRVLKRLPETKDDLHKDMKTWPDNQNESAWFYLAVQEATNSHYQKLKKDGIHEKWESMRETRDWAALEK